MKKFLSGLLSISILAAAFMGVSIVGSANEAAAAVFENSGSGVNTYDEANVSYSYRNTLVESAAQANQNNNAATDRVVNGTDSFENVDFARNGIFIEKYPETENYAAHFGSAYNYANYTSGYWSCDRINSLRIYDANNENLSYFIPEPNTKYVFKMNYRADKAPDRTMGFKLMYENDAQGVVWYRYNAANLIKNDVAVITAATDGWQTVEYAFTTGDTVKPLVLMLYTNNTGWHAANVDIWVDNISVTEYGVKNNEISFTEAQTNWNNSNLISYNTACTIADSGDSAQGNAAKFMSVLSVSDLDQGANSEWYSGHPSAFTFVNPDCTDGLYYSKGETFNISFKLKVNTAFENLGKDEFYISVISMDNANKHLGDFIKNYISQGRVANIAAVANKVTDGWVEYSANITVGHSGYIGMMFYSYGRRAFGEVFVDDIRIEKADRLDTTIDFSADQSTYMKAHKPSTTGVPYDTGDAAVGNVFKINYLIADADKINPGNQWFEAYPAGFFFVNDEGNDNLFYKKGEVLNISFKLKKNVALSTEYANEFYVCATFVETKDFTYQYVKSQLLNSGISVRLAAVNMDKSDWVTYNATITVPCDGYGSMMFYTKNHRLGDECNIWVDDVKIKRYENESFERKGDINADNKTDILDIIVMKKMFAGVKETTLAADINYDGIYGAADFTKLRKRLLGIENSAVYMLSDCDTLAKVKCNGRWDTNKTGVTLDWSASAVEFTADCSGRVGIVTNTQIKPDNTDNVLYYAVYVDGECKKDMLPVGNGVNYIELAENIDKGVHMFELIRLTEAHHGTTDAIAIEMDGRLCDRPADNKVIEFIGDSITAGAGNLGDNTTNDNVPSVQNSAKSYGYLTAKALGYDYNIAARSGIALYYGYGHTDTDDACVNFMHRYWIQNYDRDKTAVYNAKRASDIICINLGTNDFWSGKCPDAASFAAKLVIFAKAIKEDNPAAKIVLLTGGINNANVAAVTSAFETLGGNEAGYWQCNLPYGLTNGTNNHPDVVQNETMAEALVDFLRTNELV